MDAIPESSKSVANAFLNIPFSELFDLENIQMMQDLFADATGVAAILTRPDGVPITGPSNFCRLCRDIISKTEKGFSSCFQSADMFWPPHAPEPFIGLCLNGGLWNAGASISIEGFHVANWLIGQVRNEELDEQRLMQYADEIGANREEFMQALYEVPIMSAGQFSKVSKMLFAYACELSEKASNNLQLKLQIAEHEKSAALLKESEKKFKVLIDTMPNGFYRSTSDGFFTEVNHAFVKMLGYGSKEELLNVYIPTDIYVKAIERDDFDLENEDFVNDFEIYRLKTKDGRIIWIEDNARYIKDENGNVLFNEGICRDITDRKRDEAEIKLQNEELHKINAEKDKFFSIISHDLRGPFNGFLGLTQIMAEDLPSLTMDEIQKFAVSMRNSATNLFRLLENLLQWSRMQQGLIPLEQEVVKLLPLVDESIEMMIEQAKSKKIEISKNISDQLTVFIDPNIFQTVIRNLISNALKFTNSGGKISISSKITGDDTVEIAIKDSGIGMSREMIDNLFRIDVPTNRKGTEGEPSTGLGLILCKDFIEKHGGKIWVGSDEGKGSEFYFTIPLK